MMLRITAHAVERYQERVELVDEAIVRRRLSTRAFAIAETFGARLVILPTGHRAVIEDGSIVTVLSRKMRAAHSSDRHKVKWRNNDD
jgi:hypothetical protein